MPPHFFRDGGTEYLNIPGKTKFGSGLVRIFSQVATSTLEVFEKLYLINAKQFCIIEYHFPYIFVCWIDLRPIPKR